MIPMMNKLSLQRGWAAACIALAAATGPAWAEDGVPVGEWHSFGHDAANTKYSPLSQITRDNFSDVAVLWEWTSAAEQIFDENEQLRPAQFKPTPLMIDGLLYLSTSVSQVAAVDPATGDSVWVYDPESYKAGRPANLGFQHRGVAYWTDGKDPRIFIATHDRKLIALNAKTGKPYDNFGDGGAVDMSNTLGRKVYLGHITHTSPPAVCGDTIIVGSIVHDGPTMKEAPPGHVRGYDARTGEMKWIFHTIPQQGEYGNDSWENGSWKYTGATNVWSMMAVDEELGYVYLPTGTPTNDMYGGHRLGDNLFAESVICLDCETGERIWHFQAVHHGVWDYDFPTAPNLMDLVVDGKPIKALAQVSKQAFTYVFDRVSGEPVWPIEEREVPQTTVPGDRTSPTQPFPTKPAPFDRQGITEDDLIDLTPELKAKALELVKDYQLGPLFTPPVVEGTGKPTIMVPSPGGGANWPGVAFDPETKIMYIPSVSSSASFTVIKPDPNRSNFDYVIKSWFGSAPSVEGLPLLKPPFARITAIDMNTGEHLWMTPNGNGPRDHPAIADLKLGPLGASSGGPLLTKTLLFVNQSGDPSKAWTDEGPQINVFDKATGEWLGSISLPDNPHGNPITYVHKGKQYLAVAVGGGVFWGGKGSPGKLIGLGLSGG